MEVQPHLILTACIVHFRLTTVQLLSQIADQAIISEEKDGNKIERNFQKIFRSVAKDGEKKNDIFFQISLEEGVLNEQQNFDAMKEELHIAQNGNVKKDHTFYEKSITNGNVVAVKRETKQENHSTILSGETIGNSATTAFKSSTSQGNQEIEFTKEPYIFPEIQDGNALQPTLDLLLSQKRYHAEMDKIYQRMFKKNRRALYLPQVDAVISNSRLVINVDIENVRDYMTSVALTDSIEKYPWGAAASRCILKNWRRLKEWSEKMRGEYNIDAEIDSMMKVVDSAVREMEIYQKYAEEMYDEIEDTTEVKDAKEKEEFVYNFKNTYGNPI